MSIHFSLYRAGLRRGWVRPGHGGRVSFVWYGGLHTTSTLTAATIAANTTETYFCYRRGRWSHPEGRPLEAIPRAALEAQRHLSDAPLGLFNQCSRPHLVLVGAVRRLAPRSLAEGPCGRPGTRLPAQGRRRHHRVSRRHLLTRWCPDRRFLVAHPCRNLFGLSHRDLI